MRKQLIGLLIASTALFAAPNNGPLPYDQGPTPEQKQAIEFMLTNLGNKGVFSLAGMRSKLKAEGDKTASLHPLRFFLYVFETPSLRQDLKKMRGRSMVWKNFMKGNPDGFDRSFNAQADLGNMKEEYVDEYAKTLGIDPAPLWAQVKQRNWTGLIDQTFKELDQQPAGNGQKGNARQPGRAQSRRSRR